ncbi:MAG TPA: VanW family protein [Polyangiaceae bacterium]|nr:VanW family protein [Polyangiaceae bacterium]
MTWFRRLGQRFEDARFRGAAALIVAVIAGLSIGFVLVPRAPTPGQTQLPMPEVRLLGSPLGLGDGAVKTALERVRRYTAGKLRIDLPDGGAREIHFGRLGVEIDTLRLTQLVRDVKDQTSALRRSFHASGKTGPLDLPVPVVLNRDTAVAQLLLLKDEVDRLPADARLDLEKRVLIPEVEGRLLDVDASLWRLEQAIGGGLRGTSLAFEKRPPRRRAAELGNVQFDQVLGYFETRYNRARRYEARTYNLRLAASKLDGHVLLPGEVFDFNEVVGPRDEANGYKVAPVIAEGELVDGIGGGTCQISGTLHGAAFFAGLEIVERYPHTRPSSYIKMGLDATVVYPTINFRLKNPYDFPVVLHQTVKNGVVRAEILGPERTRTVTLIRRIDAAMPYEEVERDDKDLPKGVRVLSQRGMPGFKLHRYRIVRNGPHAVRERWNDVYPPTTQIIRVGTGDMPRDSVRAQDDPHPEYLADELLVMTQGDAEGEGGAVATQEWREAGEYGQAGWTEKRGMPLWKTKRDE